MSAPPTLAVRDLCVVNGADGRMVLRGIDLTIAAGRIVGLVGESGAGKSMIGRVIARNLPAGFAVSRGSAAFQGTDLLGLRRADLRRLLGRDIAFIPQEPMSALNPVLTIGAQFGEHLARLGVARSARRARMLAALAEVRLNRPSELLDKYPFQLSGGMCQRVLIAFAFAGEPKLIIADEPTTALDVSTQATIVALIRRLQRDHNTALLFITHDLRLAAHVCDDILVLFQGEVVERGPAANVLTAPREAYTQALIAANPSIEGPLPDPITQSETSVPVIDLTGVAKVFAGRQSWWGGRDVGVTAVREMDFSVRPGEFVGIVGESGSGKSTLARLIMGLEQSTRGTIRVNGIDVTANDAAARAVRLEAVQMVFQDPQSALNPRRRVADLVTQVMEAVGVSRRARQTRAAELLAATGLAPDLIHRYPAQLSGGQKQRVNIGRALCVTPKVLVADEIVSGLDVSVQAQILDLLLALRKTTGIGLIFVSHDLAVVRALCERMIVMRRGEVVEAGATATIFAAPQHAYTRMLIAAAPPADASRNWPPEELGDV